MADVYVETWAELRAAILSVSSSNPTLTVHLVKDIDCNDEIPEGVASSISLDISYNLNLTITGAYTENGVTKNHVIRNLRTNIMSPTRIFYITDGSVTSKQINFRNIDFINLILDRPLVELSTWRTAYLRFINCRFVGRRTQSLIYHIVNSSSSSSESTTVQLTSCFLNVEYKGTAKENVPLIRKTGGNYDYFYANYCRIKSTYTGWTVDPFFSPSVATGPQNITHTLRLNGCYLYGTFVGGSAQQMGITDYYNYNGSLQSVVDADFRMVGDTSAAGTSMSMVMPKGIFVSRIRKWGDDSIEYTVSNYNSSGNAKAIPIPPDKMADPAYLYAQGFDIIVPE